MIFFLTEKLLKLTTYISKTKESLKNYYSCKKLATGQSKSTLQIWLLLKKAKFFGAGFGQVLAPVAPKRDIANLIRNYFDF